MKLSPTNSLLTPRVVLDAVLDVFGEIDLDPCAEKNGARANVPARKHFTSREDGLSRPWRGRIFLNPPYGAAVGEWCRRLMAAYRSGEVTEAIVLLASRPDARWFRLFDSAPVCFVKGRLKFSEGKSGAPFPSAIFYLGTKHRARFARVFATVGSVRGPAMQRRRNEKTKSAKAVMK